MANEVEIVVKASDRTGAGFASVRRNVRQMVRGLGQDSDEGGRGAGDRLGRGFLSGLGTALTAGIKPIAATAAAGFAAQFIGAATAALVSGATKLVHGFAAGLALLPAAALTAGAALGTVKIALLGVGDALKAGLAGDAAKLDEALQGLAPSAQSVVREVAGLKGALDGLKGAVQESLFAPLVGAVRPLADTYLPAVQELLVGIASSFGQVGNQVAGLLVVPSIASSIQGAFTDVQATITNLALGVGSLVQAFIPLVTVGASFLPQLTAGFGGATARLAEFMQQAERTGELAAFIQGGIDKLQALWETAKQVGGILADVGAIISTVFSGLGGGAGGLLDKIAGLTSGVRDFLGTAEGATVLQGIFDAIGLAVLAIKGPIGNVLGLLGKVLGPLVPQIAELVGALAELAGAVIDVGLDALEPILVGLAAVLGGVVLPALTGLANWLSSNREVLQGIGIAILTLLVPSFYAWATSAAAAAAATLIALGPVILVGAAIAALAALIITHWDTIKAATAAVWDFMFGVIRGVFDWIVENWPLLLVILTGPIGAAVALIVTHWDTIKGAVEAAFNWVRDNWPLILGILTGPIGWAVLGIVSHWETIKGAFTAVKDWIGDRVDDIVEAIMSIPDRITGIGSSIKNKITSGLGGIGGAFRGLGGLTGALGFAHGGIVGAAAGGVRGGLHEVGEHGRELVKLPPGSRVYGNAMTEAMLRGGGGQKVTVEINLKGGGGEFMEWLAGQIRATSGGNVQAALGHGS